MCQRASTCIGVLLVLYSVSIGAVTRQEVERERTHVQQVENSPKGNRCRAARASYAGPTSGCQYKNAKEPPCYAGCGAYFSELEARKERLKILEDKFERQAVSERAQQQWQQQQAAKTEEETESDGDGFAFDDSDAESTSPEEIKATGNCEADLIRVANEAKRHYSETSIRRNCENQEIMYENSIKIIDGECPNTPQYQNMRAAFQSELETARRCMAATAQ